MNLITMMPMLLGVIGLIGIMQTYITPDMLSKLFGYGVVADIGTGTLMGAISAGNPAVSYIIAEELLTQGVTLYAVTAFILAWVTLGIVQLPAETSVFGLRFTLYKNILTLLSTMLVAYFTVITLQVFSS
ncbi:permease [bacterium]|nr:permease [bacterium]MBU1958740.1 permease [bacterium]